MMRRLVVAALLLAVAASRQCAGARAPTSISHRSRRVRDSIVVGPAMNITHRAGYDNQPSFTPDSRSILYTAVGADAPVGHLALRHRRRNADTRSHAHAGERVLGDGDAGWTSHERHSRRAGFHAAALELLARRQRSADPAHARRSPLAITRGSAHPSSRPSCSARPRRCTSSTATERATRSARATSAAHCSAYRARTRSATRSATARRAYSIMTQPVVGESRDGRRESAGRTTSITRGHPMACC